MRHVLPQQFEICSALHSAKTLGLLMLCILAVDQAVAVENGDNPTRDGALHGQTHKVVSQIWVWLL